MVFKFGHDDPIGTIRQLQHEQDLKCVQTWKGQKDAVLRQQNETGLNNIIMYMTDASGTRINLKSQYNYYVQTIKNF